MSADSIYAIILPVRNEGESLPLVLAELREILAGLPVRYFAGLNGCTDGSRAVLERAGVACAEAREVGYGYGCQAAIDLTRASVPPPVAYLFVAADGANDPRDIPPLLAAHQAGHDFVLGQRTTRWRNWRVMGATHSLATLSLGLWATLLTGRFYADLGPLRLIDARLLERMAMREFTWGWTIEPQILAARLGARIARISVAERPRLAGQAKIRGVSWRQTLRIGWAILCAGWRVRRRRL